MIKSKRRRIERRKNNRRNRSRAYFNVQLITICTVVKLKCAVEKGNFCSCKMQGIY